MLIKFFAPFDRIVGREVEMEIRDPLPLRALLGLLRERFPGLGPYMEEETDAGLSAYIFFVRDGKPLKLDDMVRDGDTLNALLPVTGG